MPGLPCYLLFSVNIMHKVKCGVGEERKLLLKVLIRKKTLSNTGYNISASMGLHMLNLLPSSKVANSNLSSLVLQTLHEHFHFLWVWSTLYFCDWTEAQKIFTDSQRLEYLTVLRMVQFTWNSLFKKSWRMLMDWYWYLLYQSSNDS